MKNKHVKETTEEADTWSTDELAGFLTAMDDAITGWGLIWRSVLDKHTCDMCRALHNHPIGVCSPVPPPPQHRFTAPGVCYSRRGCRCYILNVPRLKHELISAIGAANNGKDVYHVLTRMVGQDMLSKREMHEILARQQMSDHAAMQLVQLEIIEIIENFTYKPIKGDE